VTHRGEKVRLEGRVLRLGRREVPLLSGALHYWRLDPEAWAPALREVRNLGLPMVETYVPWAVHEVGPGAFDFGERNPRNALGAFIDRVEEAGLLLFLRPGPHINAELTHFGIPRRVIDDPACQARSARGNPVVLVFPPRMFPVPSYASEAFHAEAGRWFDAVGAVVRDRIWPRGPIVLLQVDNEAAYYFRNGPYDQDYHPDAVALFRQFVQSRHGGPDAAARAHGAVDADHIEPPERFDATGHEDLVPHLDWAAFQEHLIEHALTKMRARMEQAGLAGVPTVHNLPLGDGGLNVSLPGVARTVDLAGLDYYHGRGEYQAIKRRTLYLAGTVPAPYAPEMGAGAPPWFTPLDHHDSLFCIVTAHAFGLRGMNLYMAVDRDRWYGAPIDAGGTPRVEAGAYKHVLGALHRARFHALHRRVQVALMWPREYARLARAAHTLGPVSSSTIEAITGSPVAAVRDTTFGFDGPVQLRWWRSLTLAAQVLTEAGVPHVYVDSDAPEERFAGMRLVIAPTHELVSARRWLLLEALAAKGARVLHGPKHPERDEHLREARFTPIPGSLLLELDDEEAIRQAIGAAVRDLELEQPFPCTPPPVECTVHEDAGEPRVLFLLHPGSEPVQARVTVPFPLALVDVADASRMEGDAQVTVPMEPRSCRMLLIERKEVGEAARVATEGGQLA
jgi:beta-galactosidase